MHGFARSRQLLTAYLTVGMLAVALLPAGGCGPTEGAGSVATTSAGSASGSGPGDGGSASGGTGAPPAGTTGTDSGGSTTAPAGDASNQGSSGAASGPASPSVPADPCAGLVPASLGAPIEVALATSTQGSCGPSSSDPSGRMTLGTSGTGSQMWPYSASGSVQGEVMTALVPIGEDLDRWFHWTSSGFRGIVEGTSTFFPLQISTWDTSGGLIARSAVGVVAITPDGHGGSVAIVADQSASPTGPFPPKFLQWIDAAGHVTRSVSLDQDAGAVIVNWTTGDLFALVFGQSSRPTQGRWYDASGNPLTAWFSLNVQKGSGSTWHLLVDGTVVLAGPSHEWVVATNDGVEGPVAVPDWLKARPNTRVSTIRGGRAYAVVTIGIADRFEVVTPSGTSCGTVTLPSLAPQVGIYPPRLDIGQDGTVIHSVGPAAAAGGGSSSCTFQWWSGLLR